MIAAIVGPSGAGKDTLITGVLRLRPDLHLVRRTITRPSEAGGEDFEGVTQHEFDRRKARGDFALDWEAHGLCYGLPRSETEGWGGVIFNGSRAALPDALRVWPGLRVIVVTAPAKVLADRLAARGRESARDISDRLTRAAFNLPAGVDAVTVVNDSTVETGVARLAGALQTVRA